MSYLGDYATSAVIYGKFTTYRPSTGEPYTLAGTPALSVYKDGSTTQSTTGVTLTVDFDSVTGLHHFAIDTSADGTFYAAGSNFDVVITAGTVDSVSAVGSVVGSFSLAKVAALRPSTAGRTLVVDAAGLADANMVKMGPTGSGTAQTARDIGASVLLSNGTGTGQVKLSSGYISPNWGDVGNPTTTVALTNTTVGTITTYTGNTPQTGDSFALIGLTGSGLTSLAPAATALSTATWTGTLAANIGTTNTTVAANLDAAVSSRLAPTTAGRTLDVTATGAAGIDWGNVENQSTNVNLATTQIWYLAYGADLFTDYQSQVFNATLNGGVTGDIDGKVIGGGSGIITGPGVWAYDDAGAAIATASALATVAGYVDTEVAAIKAKTDNLPASPAAVSDIPTAAANADAVWDEAIAGHLTAGSTGAALNSAGSAGDPWGTALPGAYAAGSAGYILGTNLDAASSTLATPTNITAGTITTVTTLTNLPAAPTDWLTAAAVKADAVTKIQNGLATPTNITAASGVSLAANQHVIVDSGTVTTLTNLPTIPTNWLTAAGLAADAVAEIQSGLATSAALAAGVDVTSIAGSTTAAERLAANADAIITGTATAGGTSSITLQAGSANTVDLYENRAIVIVSGTGAGQTNKITASSTASPPVCSVEDPWPIVPDNTSVYQILGRIG